MGCTSSAQNTTTPYATADKSIQIEEDTTERITKVVHIEDENNTNETKVLPMCDTPDEDSIQLVRNNKSTSSLESYKEFRLNGFVTEIEKVIVPPDLVPDDEKKSKLEEVIDKVFAINLHTLPAENEVTSLNNEQTNEDTVMLEETKIDTEPSTLNDPGINVENDTRDETEETDDASINHSQSSRATRWEALADIAAELPPSLAVDPITGQIYSLSK